MRKDVRCIRLHLMAEPNLTYGAPGIAYAAFERLRSNVRGFRPQHRRHASALRRPAIAH
jgi:hypothetical protein